VKQTIATFVSLGPYPYPINTTAFKVKVGNPDYTKATTMVRSEMAVIHPFWTILDMVRHRHDIGLIKVVGW
jgi:hypothetical protein